MRLVIWKRAVYNNELTDYYVSSSGDVANLLWEKLRTRKNNRNYTIVDIYINHVKHTVLVHRLVAFTFMPNKEQKLTVNHIDGNKDHNYTSNLEWMTYSENNKHAYDTGLKESKKGKNSAFAKYSDETILAICSMLEHDPSPGRIAKALNVPRHIVASIKNRTAWVHLSKDFTFLPPKYYTTDEIKKTILDLFNKGYNIEDICNYFGWDLEKKYKRRIKRVLRKIFNDYPNGCEIQQ